jgi:hypothetical protein
MMLDTHHVEAVGVDPSLVLVDPDDAMRAGVLAISKREARALCDAVASAQLPAPMAQSLLRQAWRSDVKNDMIGVRMSSGGLVSAVFLGTSRAQQSMGTFEHGDNAITLLADLAVTIDDPRVVDVLFDWEPTFRMATPDVKGTIESTAAYFFDSSAPKCAQRMMERKNELAMASRNAFVYNASSDRALRNAKRILEKGMTSDEFALLCLQDVIDDEGKPQVVKIQTADDDRAFIFSIGLALIGRSELVTVCSRGKAAAVEARMQVAVRRIMEDSKKPPTTDGVVVKLPTTHPLFTFAAATKHLRNRDTRAFVPFEHPKR